jgi:hypothetical protein
VSEIEGGTIVAEMHDRHLSYLRGVNARLTAVMATAEHTAGWRCVTTYRPGFGTVYLRVEDGDGQTVLTFDEVA